MGIRELAAAAVETEKAKKVQEAHNAEVQNSIAAVRYIKEYLEISLSTTESVTFAPDYIANNKDGSLQGDRVVVGIDDVYVKVRRVRDETCTTRSPVHFVLCAPNGDAIEHPVAKVSRTSDGELEPIRFSAHKFTSLATMAPELARLDLFMRTRDPRVLMGHVNMMSAKIVLDDEKVTRR